MVSETAIAIRKPITPEVWQMVQSIAPVTAASRMFGVTKEQAAVIMLTGYELGLGLISAFKFIHLINGKPSISPQGALALIHKSGLLESFEIVDEVDEKGEPTGCKITMKRKNGLEYTTRFTLEDAKRAGLLGKDNWQNYPGNMSRWRTFGYCMDVLFPDVAGGMYRPEELGADVDEKGEPLLNNWQVEKPVVTTTPLPEPTERVVVVKSEPEKIIEQVVEQVESPKEEKPEVKKVPVLSDLIEKHGAQAILDVLGRIPATDDELVTVAENLESNNAS
jgi:hypothetical protein